MAKANVGSQDRIQEETGEKGWVGLEFSGFTPDDQRSSLLRRWKGWITAFRSDGEVIKIAVVSEQSDTPHRIGIDLQRTFETLESYRNCDCTAKEKCAVHAEVAGNGDRDAAATV